MCIIVWILRFLEWFQISGRMTIDTNTYMYIYVYIYIYIYYIYIYTYVWSSWLLHISAGFVTLFSGRISIELTFENIDQSLWTPSRVSSIHPSGNPRTSHWCAMNHSCLWHDAFVVWDMSHANVWYDSFTCVFDPSTWNQDLPLVCLDLFMCVTWPIRMWDMRHPNAWHESITRLRSIHLETRGCPAGVSWRIQMCGTTHFYVGYESSKCVIWLVYTCLRSYII